MTEQDRDARAESTARFAIQNAIATTCVDTGLRPGPAVDALIDEIIREVRSPAVGWAFKAIASDQN